MVQLQAFVVPMYCPADMISIPTWCNYRMGSQRYYMCPTGYFNTYMVQLQDK